MERTEVGKLLLNRCRAIPSRQSAPGRFLEHLSRQLIGGHSPGVLHTRETETLMAFQSTHSESLQVTV